MTLLKIKNIEEHFIIHETVDKPKETCEKCKLIEPPEMYATRQILVSNVQLKE